MPRSRSSSRRSTRRRPQIASAEASLSFATADNTRYGDLMKTGYGTVQRAQLAESALREKTAALQKDRAGLVVAERKIDVLTSERAKAEAQRDRNLATQHQAELNLSYTSITAPVDGTVGARALRVGQYVQAGTALMAVVPLDAVYVVANYKETQLANVRPGQKVEIEIDSFPGKVLHGHVDSLSPASGLEFALLPPDNATGNFTKIVQRVPVKIAFDDKAMSGLLRPGMSAEPSIDTKPARLSALLRAARVSCHSMAVMRAAQPDAHCDARLTMSWPQEPAMSTSVPATVSTKTWIAVIASTLGAFMAILNIQIVNASLADIQGAIGAGIDDGGWISTSYLVAEIIVIPLTAWLARVFGVRLYLIVNAALFLFFSAACAFAQNLEQMIVLRALQGFSGGVLIPMAFTLIITLLPQPKQPIGLAMFAIAATFAPAIGPTIGGYLTENWGWEFIFYLNLVPGSLMLALLWISLERSTDAAWPAAPGRLVGHRHHGDRPRRAADRARGGQQGRLAGLALHREAAAGGGHRPPGVRLDRAQDGASAPQPAPAAAPQLRLRRRWRCSCSASRSTARSSSCRSISPACRATIRSRSAWCWPGPACRSSC